MIITLTLNAALDKIAIVENFKIGDKAHPIKELIKLADGKGVNVARAIKGLGREVLALGFLGGPSGEWIEKKLKEEGIPGEFIKIKKETRSNLTILDPLRGTETHLREPGPEVSPEELRKLKKRLASLVKKECLVIISGSIPPNAPREIYKDLIRMIRKKGGKVILDSEGEPFALGIKEKPYIVKCNRRELGSIFGGKLKSRKELIGKGKYLLKRGIEAVVISLGKKGALALHRSGSWQAKPPEIEAVDSVGSGDALTGGLTVALEEKKRIENALRLGVACGAANALSPGRGVCRKEDIERIYEEVKLSRL
jgi:1-phosphofructokinase family hexose kinase